MYIHINELRNKRVYSDFNLNYQDELKRSYLHSSVLKKDYDTSLYLINENIDISLKDLNNYTAIDYIINLDLANILVLVIEHYKDIDYFPYYFKALELARTNIIRIFHTFNIIPRNNYLYKNENILYCAIKSLNKEYFNTYYDKRLVKTKDNNNALFVAINCNNKYAFNKLLETNRDLINSKYNNKVLLDIAFELKDTYYINLLLKHGAFIFLSKYENSNLYKIENDPNYNYKELYPLHFSILTNKVLDLNIYNLMQKDPYDKLPIDYASKEQKEIINNYLKKEKLKYKK